MCAWCVRISWALWCLRLVMGCPGECLCSEQRIVCHRFHLAHLPLMPNDTKELMVECNEGVESDDDVTVWELFHEELIASLLHLRLERCDQPSLPLNGFSKLRYLNLAGNKIEELCNHCLPTMPELRTLDLRLNKISYIGDNAFANTPEIRTLHLDGNQINAITASLHHLHRLQDLSIARNQIVTIAKDSFGEQLIHVDLSHNPLTDVHSDAFHKLPSLRTLLVSGSRGLRQVPTLASSRLLTTLRADRARIVSVPNTLCLHSPNIHILDLKLNELSHIPDIQNCTQLKLLDLSSNRISLLSGRPLRGTKNELRDLMLARNMIRRVPRDVFTDVPNLETLDLEDNRIEHIDNEAFLPFGKLLHLNVGNNVFPALPAVGLHHLRVLKAFNNPQLRRFHPPELLPKIQTLVLSYAYHCCEFMTLMKERESETQQGDEEEQDDTSGLQEMVLQADQRNSLPPHNYTHVYAHYLNQTSAINWRATVPRSKPTVTCVPMPGPFLPCVDLFEWWTLRCGVWAVFLLALLGNGTVVFVLVFSRSRLDVPRFLVANLAAADFFMGLYLGFLAVVDAGTLGEFREHAVAWQLSPGCKLAGFFAVLSSELSVFTLAVITLERNYAITHAMHLNKRLSLRHAATVMAFGWAFALAAATLPLLGVSDYRKFAICLPFETSAPADLGYVTALLSINGAAFLVLLGCYLKMYCAIRGSQAWNSNDSRIAKRMALLVFTDFICWAPIAFFALTAAFGADLVSLEEAKVFTVFVLPLNSCCNPFLYAILTKQFKKDCALVCKAIEESRVTRGIGRCRHSSNFSNRQTPANTSSLAERSSRGHAPSCACRRLLASPAANASFAAPHGERLLRWLRACGPAPPAPPLPPPPHRTPSMSSSAEFSSSRSDSWRLYGGRPPPPRRAASWLVARKTSQDSSLSSSRNDSSGSNATASTNTWRTSRSTGGRPRLTRQPAIHPDDPPDPTHPPPLHTIPSATENESIAPN